MTDPTAPRLLVYIATDVQAIADLATARAGGAAFDTRVVIVSGDLDRPQRDASRPVVLRIPALSRGGPTLDFLGSLANLDEDFRPRDHDIVCRIECRTAGLDEIDRMIAETFARNVLEPGYLALAVQDLSKLPNIGLATPAGLPRVPLARSGDATLHDRLARELSLTPKDFDDTYYFPQLTGFVRGALYNALARRYADAAAALEQAVSLGFHALCRCSGLATTDISPKARLADGATLHEHSEQVLARSRPADRHPEHRPATVRDDLPARLDLKYIAYYLPQFHAIPENDEWWGAGFTEWTNVSKAAARFVGHDQPQLPADLGFYDLARPEVISKQVELARAYGIHGFCFYYYWFNGRTLLETPVRNFLNAPEVDFPFCLCWANENWTRRWDGQENEVLMEQSHSPRDDLRFIEHIAPYMRDPRYIRVGDKPLLLVYRAALLDDAKATAGRWREYCRGAGIGEIHLAAVCSFDIDDPRPFGFDSAVEFPPHQLRNMPPINPDLTFVDRNFSGEVLDYRQTVLMSALAKYADTPKRPFPTIHGVMTGWDNDARRPGRGRIFHHANPSAYANWLRLASTHTRRHNPPELQYVFINAWNEWAEGAHLEPDRRFGHARLAATADTLRLFNVPEDRCPPDLGSSAGALGHIKAHLLRPPSTKELSLYRERIRSSGRNPRMRVVLATDAMCPELLDTLYSLAEQCFRDFGLSIVSPRTGSLNDWFDHPGIDVETIQAGNPLAGLLDAAGRHTEDWLIPLWPGDRLFPHSLLAIAAALATAPDTQLLISDELVTDHETDSVRARFRTPPAPARTLAAPPDGTLLAITRQDFVGLGGMNPDMAGASETDLLLRVVEHHGWDAIQHLPEILVWRNTTKHPDLSLPKEARTAKRRGAVQAHLARTGCAADVVAMDDGTLQVVRHRDQAPLVSVVIPTHDQPEALQRCIESLFAHTTYPNYEIIVIDHDNTEPQACAFLDGLAAVDPTRIRILQASGPFDYGALNNAGAAQARGDFLLFLNDDTCALHPEWLDRMVDEAIPDDVGLVSPRLVFPDGRLQNAGVVLGMSGMADFPWTGAALDDAGPEGALRHVREVSAATGACLLVRRALFDRIGGFDPGFPVGYGDFDLCLRAGDAGARIVWTPHATLMHEAGRSLKAAASDPAQAARMTQAFQASQEHFFSRWRQRLAQDPHYSPNLSLTSRQGVPESHPELARDPIDWRPLPNVLALPADDGGSGQYRVVQPARAAHAGLLTRSRVANGYPLAILFDRLGIDTLHTQRQVDDAQLATLERLRKQLSIRIVMDFDDLLTAVPEHSHHKGQIWPDIARRVTRACELSDCVTVSTAPLAEQLRKLHGDVRVVPNAIDLGVWKHLSEPPSQGKLRIGWAGGLSHAGDLAVIREVVRRFADEVEWVFLGMCLEDIRPHLTEFHRGVPFAQYPTKLASLGLDLAIAPLEQNAFNDCKSNLRLLEYGALGIPVIASDALPYRCGLPVTLVGNRPADWITAIRERVGERGALARDGAALRDAVLRDWTLETRLADWRSAWTS